MFNYETENIIRKVQNQVIGTRDTVSLRHILSVPIHDSIKVFFRASITEKHGGAKRFQTEHSFDPDLTKQEIDLLLPSNYTISKDTFISLLTDAVNFNFNYLCRPRWTMKEFFFHNSETLTVADLKEGFLYFSAYEYYPKVLFRYLQKNNIHQIDGKTFDKILDKIDNLVLGDATPDDYALLLQPFSEFIAYGREDNDDSIPEHALALFFGDKGFDDIRNYIESALRKDGIEKITIPELKEFLTHMPADRTYRQEPSIEKIPDESPVTPDVKTEPEEIESSEATGGIEPETTGESTGLPVVEEPFEEEPAEDAEDIKEDIREFFEPDNLSEKQEETEFRKKFTEDDLFRPIQKEPEVIENIPEEPTEDFIEIEEKLSDPDEQHDEMFAGDEISDEETFPEEEVYESDDASSEETEDNEQTQPPVSMPPLELLIEDDEKKRFIRKLFNNDAAYFDVVVQSLNKMSTWKEASLYIDEIFLVNGVDPYSSDAVNFTDKVYTRFSHKSMYK